MCALYSDAFSRIAWPPSASSWLTSPSGPELPQRAGDHELGHPSVQTGCIISDVIIMSRPK